MRVRVVKRLNIVPLRLGKDDVADALKALRLLIVKPEVVLIVNGERVPSREPLVSFEADLQTDCADGDGNLRRTHRIAPVSVYRPLPGEEGSIYELGIPVVETGDTFVVDVGQKIPLNMERDNVTPSFLRRIRTLVLENCHGRLDAESASSAWVKDAMSSPDVAPEAVRDVVRLRFGDKVVSQDPSDPEANKLAVQEGYAVLHGKTFSREEWQNVRAAETVLPAGKVTPSPKVVGAPHGVPRVYPDKWTPATRAAVDYIRDLSKAVLGHDIIVEVYPRLTQTDGEHSAAAYGNCRLSLSLAPFALGRAIEEGDEERLDRTLIHEFAHDTESDHFSAGFNEACCRIGARLRDCPVRLAFYRRERGLSGGDDRPDGPNLTRL
jgi:hypothetical protein